MTQQDPKIPAPITAQVAHVLRDPFVSYFQNLMRPVDSTLATRGGASGLAIYDEIERDCHAYSVLQKRKMAVVARPWFVDPASGSALDQKAADLVRANLENIAFDRICLDLQDALLKGYAVGEILYEVNGSEIRVSDVVAREQKRFVFNTDSQLRMLTTANMLTGEELPERKFVVHRFGSKIGNPYGLGLGTRLFWPVFFKRQGIQFWLIFCDKFGSPTAVGKYPTGTSDADQGKLLDALQSIAQDSGIAIPDTMSVSLLEAARSGSIDTFEKLCRYMDDEISKATLGETLSTTMKGGGSYAAAKTHNEVRLELVQADANLLTDTLQETVVKWLTEYNCPGAGVPRVYREVKPEEDLKVQAETDKLVFDMGFEPSEEYVRTVYGDGWKKRAPGSIVPTTAAFAEGSLFADQATLDAALAALPGSAGQALQTLIKPALRAIAQSASPDEAMDALLEAFPAMDSAQLEAVLARAFFVSDLWGRLSAKADAAGT